MILPDTRWNKVKRFFTEEERMLLTAAVTGETAMQRGYIIELTKLPPGLRAKVEFHFLGSDQAVGGAA